MRPSTGYRWKRDSSPKIAWDQAVTVKFCHPVPSLWGAGDDWQSNKASYSARVENHGMASGGHFSPPPSPPAPPAKKTLECSEGFIVWHQQGSRIVYFVLKESMSHQFHCMWFGWDNLNFQECIYYLLQTYIWKIDWLHLQTYKRCGPGVSIDPSLLDRLISQDLGLLSLTENRLLYDMDNCSYRFIWKTNTHQYPKFNSALINHLRHEDVDEWLQPTVSVDEITFPSSNLDDGLTSLNCWHRPHEIILKKSYESLCRITDPWIS